MSEIIFKFACGPGKPTDHEHDDKLWVLTLKEGGQVEDTKENREKYKGKTNGQSVACSICGHAAIDDAYWY